jgi:hypothetical protein
MNRYMLLLYADEQVGLSFSETEMDEAMAIMGAYADALQKAGALVSHGGLSPTGEARTITNFGGELKVHNGPYVESQEQLGGYYLIEAANMEEAQQWAARCPASTWGHVEIRPLSRRG